MTTRGATRRTRATFHVDPRRFAWSRWVVATLSHVTVPWRETLSGLGLAEAVPALGERDRLSLLAQFSAHQALLTFAGIADGPFLPDEWMVVTSRGCDARLIRIGASAADPEQAPPAVASARLAADALGVSVDVLAQPWVRPDHVYADAFGRLAGDVTADLRWARRAAYGSIDSPGPEALSTIGRQPASYRYDDAACVRSLQRLASGEESVSVEVIGGVSPLQRLSAIATMLADPSASEAVAAEQLIAGSAGGRRMVVVTDAEAVDAASWRVIEIASGAGHDVWVTPRGVTPLPRSRWFLVAPSLAVRHAVEARLRAVTDPAAWLEQLVLSPYFHNYVTNGELPAGHVGAIDAVAEPTKSFIGALALIGRRVPRDVARCFLQHFLFSGSLDELGVPGVLDVDAERLSFVDDDMRREACAAIPRASRAAICRVAATLTEGVTSALLWHEAGETEQASAILRQTEWSTAEAAVEALREVPRSLLSPPVAARYAQALFDCGRYRDARSAAALASPDDREPLIALTERRSGDYAAAIERLTRLTRRTFAAQLLYAELLRLTGRCEEAAVELTLCRADSDEERVRLGYELAVLALDCGFTAGEEWLRDDYLSHRFATYRSLARSDYVAAAAAAEQALARAGTACERIDASLDRMYTAFVAGEWDAARAIGIEALQQIEETQGDRAAGGILFTLAYLAADNGQWEYAANRIEVLRRYYAGVHDERRQAELRLLTAHLEFGRGRFDLAAGAAADLYESRSPHDQIREAAALILDEIDWLEERPSSHRSRGGAGNAELARRHARLGALRRGETPTRGSTLRVCEQLELFREAIARGDTVTASAFAAELRLAYDPGAKGRVNELEILTAAATRDFPFGARDFAQSWCFATRNRLGQWNMIGSLAVDRQTLETLLAAAAPDWVRCSDRELLFIDGCSRWSRETRDAVAAVFHLRAENDRMHRLLEQEEPLAPRQGGGVPDGMIGESMAMRAVYERIAKVAGRDVQVCILGESGTGKELVSRAIHRQSVRRQKPFVTLNCAALPENLIESELFGHVRGAFTGADRDRTGLIDSADGGTLFLDEIGELPLTAQAKLLRFLQDGEYRRVGDTAIRTADVRIVSATNRPLESRVEEGLFRDDLYYRIRGVEVHLPPLRDRGGDIALLASHFVSIEKQRHRGGPARLSDDAEAAVAAYGWPGNVRELQNAIRAAHALAGDARQIEPDHLPERLRSALRTNVPAGSYQDEVARFRRNLIERSLAQASGNQNRAAALLRISRQALAYQIRELGILVGRTPSMPL